ncbi:sugar porter family MFS transporter [Persicobacter psychrovividus]|uniref:D-xylose transporter XylE n=1 Tax=Persicobacter psychrovividus TaxID=387638 RepID=A0ABM7VL97_9BACT|nr:D-xylose transporter XylE [Persicobacter psychrovividus]
MQETLKVAEPEIKSGATNYFFIVGITLVAALGGLLFGYDTAVISGAIGPLREYFNLSAAEMGWAASSAQFGCMFGAAIAGWWSNRFGRRQAMLLAAVLFSISAVGSGLADNFTMFSIYRIVGGVGVGLASMVSPLYIAEMAPAEMRGKLVACNQFAIIFGMLVVYFVNYGIAVQGDAVWNVNMGWRYMFGSETIPALAFFIMLFFVPESPRWLVMKNRDEQASQVLQKIGDVSLISAKIAEIRDSLSDKAGKKIRVNYRNMKVVWVIFVGVCISIFQQITGINVFLYFAPEIFKNMGSGADSAMLQTIIVGAVNLSFTVVAIYTVDKVGRKPLMLIGALGMGICITAIGFAAYFENTAGYLLIFVLGYIACFAVSLGPVTWVLLSEIFPNKLRGTGMAIAVAAQWISNALVAQTFPMMMENETLDQQFHGGFPFWVYGLMCFVTIAFIYKCVPETKGKSLEEMEELWDLKD